MKTASGFGLPKPYSLFIPLCIAVSAAGLVGCGDDADTTPSNVSANAPVPLGLTASTNVLANVHLDWQAPKDRAPTGYVIQRDGADLATIPSNPTRYDDMTALAGALTPPADLTASQGTRPEAVRLAWTAATAKPGKTHVYTIAALYDAERSPASNQALGSRAAPGLTGHLIQRDSKDLITVAADAATYDDATASAGTVGAPKSFTASNGTVAEAVALAWGDSDETPGGLHTYSVAAVYDGQKTAPTNAATGSRAEPFITAFIVTRDDADVATVPSSTRSFNDTGATAGDMTAPAGFTATNGTVSDRVTLAWGTSTTTPGPTHTYTLSAQYDGNRSPASASAVGSRAAATVDGYLLQRDGVTATILLATDMTYDDFDATSGTVGTPSTLTATAGTRSDAIALSWAPPATTAGPAHAYTLMALAGTRKGTAATATGARSAPTITGYLVQRDASDLDTTLGTVTTYTDGTANGGLVNAPSSLTATAGTRADAVALTWGTSTATAGQSYSYTVAALYDGNQGDFSTAANGARGTPTISGYVVQRDGTDLDTLPAGSAAYVDTDATPGTVTAPTAFTATQGTRSDAVGLTWGASTSSAGPSHVYAVAAYYDDTQSAWSATATGSRAKPAINGYLIQRDGTDLVTLAASETSYDDKTVPSGTLSASIVALPDAARTYVQLRVPTAPTFTAPDPSTYWISPVISIGDPPVTDPITGFRGMGDKVTYQWQRSTDDGTDTYTDIAGVTGSAWFDTTPPIGEGRYYRATMKSEGATGTTDEGRVELQGFKSVGAGLNHACGVRTDDKVICWGDNSKGQAPPDATDGAFLSVSAGDAHTCARRDDSGVVCWGDNTFGQAPVSPSDDAFVNISAGASHTCGVRDDDKVLCWGNNTRGQAPAGPSTADFKVVAAGAAFTCGLRTDNKAVCWGDNTLGQAPVGPTTDTYTAISSGDAHVCLVRSDKKIVCWGDSSKGQTTPPATPAAFKAVASGKAHSCGIGSDDKIVCWGDNGKGQAPAGPSTDSFLGVSAHGNVTCGVRTDNRTVCWGDNSSDQAPPSPSSDSFLSVASGNQFTCGVRADGKSLCFGENGLLQAPAGPSVDSFLSVSAGDAFACGVRSDATLACWGDNTNGQAPPSPSSDSFSSVAAGFDHACAVRADGKVVCWGDNALGQAPAGPTVDSFLSLSAGNGHTCGIRSGDKKLVCWGDDSLGQAPPGPSADAYLSVAAGSGFTCAIRSSDHKRYCWGVNDFGQAPAGPSTDSFDQVVAGTNHACGLRTDKQVVCWGDDSRQQAPTTASLDAFTNVSAGSEHTCGVREDKRLVCWGQNDKAQAPRP